MSVEHERLKEILAEAASKETAEARAAYLDAACQGDAGLRRQVEGLLEAHTRAGDFLEQSVIPPEEQPIGEGPGTIIGRYKLLEEIGEGGFGRVFMAEQTEPVHRKVALKIVKAGMDTREVIARFEAERQALALMDHPNIAKIFDAGVTGAPSSQLSTLNSQLVSGRPYFVMELVRGMPITEYCDQQQLPTAERLQLFMKVCAAVQHAHQKGIIHRDLKPTNILVTLVDGEAVPKVIDFGVAKALGQKLTEKTLFTAFHQMIGTPAYMSPEQAALSGVDVDTRSDIYSLGVLLYELLTGVTPFDADTLRKAALDEIRRLISETDPPKPSTRLMVLSGGQKSEGRSQKWKEVHGDLDWIAMKCLEKDRARRYETANNLAQDIERHLNHEPVTAAAPGAAYRLGKFVRRHRFGFASASALFVLLLAGVAVSSWQAVRATRAEKEAKTAATFLQDMLNSVTPEQAKGKDTTLLRQMLDQAAARVDKELKSQPLTEAALRNTLGEVYLALGQYPKAEPMFRRSLEVRERTLGKQHPDTLAIVNGLANLLYRKGDYAGAEPLLRRALEGRERTLGKEHPDTLASVNGLANLLNAKGDYAGAEPLYRRALEGRERTLGKEHPDTLKSVNNLAFFLRAKGDYAGAEPLYRRALEAQERTLGNEHPDTLSSVNGLAVVLATKGDYAGAEPLYRRAREGRERTLGIEHPDTLQSVNGLAVVLANKKGDYAGAESLIRRALEAQERTLGEEHPDTLQSVHNLPSVLAAKGDYAAAEPLHRRALVARERTLGKEHPDTLQSVNSLAGLFYRKGDSAGAEPLLRRALEARERTLGKEHPNTLVSAHDLAVVLEKKGDYGGAEPLYRRALEGREHTLGKEHPNALASVNGLAILLYRKGDFGGAELLYRRVLEARERTLGKDWPDTLASVNGLAISLYRKGDYGGAEPLYRRAWEAQERWLGKEHPNTLVIVNNLAILLSEKGDYAAAEPLYRRALEGRERTLGMEHSDTLGSVMGLAGLLKDKGDCAGAEPLCRRALEAQERTLGKEHPNTLASVNNLAILLYEKGDYAGAEPLFRRALEGHERTLGQEHPSTLNSVRDLADLLDRKGDYAGAEPLYRQAAAVYRHLADQRNAAAQCRLATMYALGQGVATDEKEAMRWYRKSAETGSAQTLNEIACTFATSGNPKLRDPRDAVLFAEKAVAATDRKNPEFLDTLAAAYAEAGQFTNAATVQREAMALLQSDAQKSNCASRLRLYESGSPYHELGLWAGQILAMLRNGKFAEAEPLARECLADFERQLPDDWQTLSARSLLGGGLLGQKKYAEAEPLLLSGYEGMKQREEKIPAAGRPRLKEALQRLVQLYETTGRTNQVAEWKQKLAEFEQAESAKPPAAPPR